MADHLWQWELLQEFIMQSQFKEDAFAVEAIDLRESFELVVISRDASFQGRY